MFSSYGRVLFTENLSAFDPFHRLPEMPTGYEIVASGTALGHPYSIIVNEDGVFRVVIGTEEVARACVKHGDNYLTSVRVDEDWQRQGIGTHLYHVIESRIGRRLRPSPNGVTPAAQALWKKRWTTN